MDRASHHDAFAQRDVRQHLADLVGGERRGFVQIILCASHRLPIAKLWCEVNGEVPPYLVIRINAIWLATEPMDTGRFSAVEGDRMVALMLSLRTPTLFEDDVTAATEWLSPPARGLGSKCPLEIL